MRLANGMVFPNSRLVNRNGTPQFTLVNRNGIPQFILMVLGYYSINLAHTVYLMGNTDIKRPKLLVKTCILVKLCAN